MEIVADANVLLAAALGGRAKLVLRHPDITHVYTTEPALDDVFEYIGRLARKKRLPEDVAIFAAAALPVIIVAPAEYERLRSEAERRIGSRDPDDMELLALALHLRLPIWSNDNDFAEARVEWHTTANLLLKLGVASR